MAQKIKLPRGVMTRIAASLTPPVTPTAVSLVFAGKSRSARITAAIERELAKAKGGAK